MSSNNSNPLRQSLSTLLNRTITTIKFGLHNNYDVWLVYDQHGKLMFFIDSDGEIFDPKGNYFLEVYKGKTSL